MAPLTVISDPSTGMPFESHSIFHDAATAYRLRPEEFRPLTVETRILRTPDGCTVGENADWLAPGEYVEWHHNGLVREIRRLKTQIEHLDAVLAARSSDAAA